MADPTSPTQGTSTAAADSSVAAQEAILQKNKDWSISMAWLQAAQDIAKKIKG